MSSKESKYSKVSRMTWRTMVARPMYRYPLANNASSLRLMQSFADTKPSSMDISAFLSWMAWLMTSFSMDSRPPGRPVESRVTIAYLRPCLGRVKLAPGGYDGTSTPPLWATYLVAFNCRVYVCVCVYTKTEMVDNSIRVCELPSIRYSKYSGSRFPKWRIWC